VLHSYAYRLQVELSTASNIRVGVERRDNAASQYSHVHFRASNAPGDLGLV
jgi:hypothetical protein